MPLCLAHFFLTSIFTCVSFFPLIPVSILFPLQTHLNLWHHLREGFHIYVYPLLLPLSCFSHTPSQSCILHSDLSARLTMVSFRFLLKTAFPVPQNLFGVWQTKGLLLWRSMDKHKVLNQSALCQYHHLSSQHQNISMSAVRLVSTGCLAARSKILCHIQEQGKSVFEARRNPSFVRIVAAMRYQVVKVSSLKKLRAC